MPVEFLTDEQAAGYAAFRGAPARAELERFFFLDDADRELVEAYPEAIEQAHAALDALRADDIPGPRPVPSDRAAL
ncbi:DUF4158 domain-containing protein [Kitasatospora sp. NPDC004272]